jgi:hypothetical protein
VHGVRWGLIVVSMLGAWATPAHATIVYEHGNEIWAMNDDGSDQRPLAAAAPGAEAGLGDLAGATARSPASPTRPRPAPA